MRISGYVPCFNSQATIAEAVKSLREQTRALDELFVVDDGSTDKSVERVRSEDVRIISMGQNLGRGAARARGIIESTGDLVLACDATARLDPSFLEKALIHFENKKTAAVVGRIIDPKPRGLACRWRNRHLFRLEDSTEVRHDTWLATWGVLMRKDAVMQVGNFNARFRHSEDADLGARLRDAGWDIVFEPAAELYPLTSNSVGELLERYWRWHAGPEEKFRFGHYLKQIVYSISFMAARDFRERDPLSALISLWTPHYALWRAIRS